MVRMRLRILTLAATASLIAGPAFGADYSQPMPSQQPYIVQQPQQGFAEGWYLRGFVGVGMNNNFKLEFLENPAHSTNFAFDQNSNSDTVFVGGGVGYEWNNCLRFDVTAEYRGRTQVNARGVFDQNTGQGDAYQGYIKSWVFLGNAFVDLGTWNCFTPFVGFGVGGSYVTLADFVDMGIGTTGAGFGRNSSKWNFAWALHAGVAYDVSKSLKIELAYRYLNYGSVTDTIDCIGGCIADSYKFSNLHSHDIMLSLRWICCETAPPPRYVYTPPPPVYTPPPPPLRSRG
jgi:opacity protein-like surface antigen